METRQKNRVSVDDVLSRPASRRLLAGAGHATPEALVARGRGEVRQGTGNRPRLAGQRGGAQCSGKPRHAAEVASRRPLGADGKSNAEYRPPVGPASRWMEHVWSRSCEVFNRDSFWLVVYTSARRDAGGRTAWSAAAVALSLGGECPPNDDAGGLAASLLKRSSLDELWTTRVRGWQAG